jgi:hypothetical protein
LLTKFSTPIPAEPSGNFQANFSRIGKYVRILPGIDKETSGVWRAVLTRADQAVAIPMLGMANSLNAAPGGAIVLHELMQRCAAG